MIDSKADYEFYLEADRIALGIGENNSRWDRLIDNRFDIWRFEQLLRKVEYYINCKLNCKHLWIWKYYTKFLEWKLKREGRKLGFIISPNVFGPGLAIVHPGTLIVNGSVRVGENCMIQNCVHLASRGGPVDACPKIGNNVFIGAGTVILGDIEIADGIAIGANSLVNKSFLEKCITIAGNPAKKINDKGSDWIFGRATDSLRASKMVQLDLRNSKLDADESRPNLRLVVKNTGYDTWTKETLLRIGTSHEKDHFSAYYHSSWISPNRVCTFSEEAVPPGKKATFNCMITPNKSVLSETFQLVIEHKCWIINTDFEIKIER